ncbi:hypothetical protein [Pseudomonas yamanorum]|uniref:DUF7940 domain-containing protein n=1 Tax=Pseudomonas yamanorum TaxID=515393 RepID=UPI002ED29F09|nr:hypothetical protein VYI69_13510 [Pseudomonas yamanorum]
MKLIDNVGAWHKLWSVRLALAGAVLNAGAIGWTVFQGAVNPLIYAAINMSLGICVAVVRVLAQSQPPSGGPQ